MEEKDNKQHSENSEFSNLVSPLVTEGQQFYQTLNGVKDDWHDKAADNFRHEVSDHLFRVTSEYINGVDEIEQRLNIAVEEAKKLTSWKAGSGGWLSITDIGMLVDRGLSRLIMKRDDYRF